jgi:PAS domain S-box-containing protein
LIDTDAKLLRWAYDSGVRSGFTDDEIAQLTIPVGIGATGIAVAEGRVIAADDMLAVHFPESEINDHFFDVTGFRSMIIAPITGESGPLGALEVYSRAPGAFGEDDAALIRALADQAAIALTNSKLYELLGNSEARYRHLVQNSPDLVWSIDADARFTFVSDTCERLTGWRPDELLGKHFGALVHESSGDVAEIDWTTGITREFQELRGRLNLLHRDGHPIPAEFSAFGTLDGEGRFAGANGSVRDMSERDRLERELRESEERYRFLVENAPDIIFSIDTDGRLVYISESVRRALGYDPDQLVGRPFRDIVAYDEPGEPGKRFNEMREDPSLEITSDLQLIHRDGRRIPFEVSSRGVVRGGEFAGIHGSARDISERNRLERELRESEERYRFLVENSPDVVFATDVDGNFTYLSETIERMTGRSPAELVGGHFSRIVHDASLPTALERWSNLESEPNKEQIARINLLHRDGRLVPVEVSAIGTTIDGRFVGIHGATRDISERERLEQDLRRQAGELASSQERAHLARELHDSVTQALFSMTLVTRTTEILVDRDSAAAKEQLASLRDLQREALAEMRALIFELRPGNIEQDGLIPALRTHAAALQGRIGLPILVTSELTERLPLPIEEVLYRISQEALHNVVKHAGARQVTLAIERTTGAVRLRIADDGKGFDSAQVPDGHLGLAGMRARADKIGAEFSVSSRPAAGTTIEVSVPEVIIAAASSAE